MCDTNSSRFFRPWSGSPCSSPRITSDHDRNTAGNGTQIKREEDNESVTSVSTYGDYSTGNSSDPEASSDHGTTKRVRHRSESSVEATSSSSSTHSDDVATDNSLHRLSKFVLASPTMNNFPVTELLPNPSASSAKAASFSTSDCPTPVAVHPMDYLQRIALHSNTFGALNDSSNALAMAVGPVPQASTIATTGQPFCYDYPRLPHFDGSLYGSSMQQAVDMIHRQDAAVKQMKKLRPKKFRCEHCDVAFSNNGQLKGHIRIHTGKFHLNVFELLNCIRWRIFWRWINGKL